MRADYPSGFRRLSCFVAAINPIGLITGLIVPIPLLEYYVEEWKVLSGSYGDSIDEHIERIQRECRLPRS